MENEQGSDEGMRDPWPWFLNGGVDGWLKLEFLSRCLKERGKVPSTMSSNTWRVGGSIFTHKLKNAAAGHTPPASAKGYRSSCECP